MPTADRPAMAARAIDMFLRQSYEPRELLVLDDGAAHLVPPPDPRVRYLVSGTRAGLGPKRRQLVELARGRVVCLWDDDDLHGPDRLRVQVAALAAGVDAVYFDRVRGRDEAGRHYEQILSGGWPGTLAFTWRFYDEVGPYGDADVGADRVLLERAWMRGVAVAGIDGRDHYTLVRHRQRRTIASFGSGWRELPDEDARIGAGAVPSMTRSPA